MKDAVQFEYIFFKSCRWIYAVMDNLTVDEDYRSRFIGPWRWLSHCEVRNINIFLFIQWWLSTKYAGPRLIRDESRSVLDFSRRAFVIGLWTGECNHTRHPDPLSCQQKVIRPPDGPLRRSHLSCAVDSRGHDMKPPAQLYEHN